MRFRLTRWDVRAALGAVALGVLLFVVACAIGGATDEGGVRWSMRIARAVPMVPLCGAAVTFLVLRRAARRGEQLALESIGCSPARAAAATAFGAALLSVAAAGFVVEARGGALDAFFPRAVARGEVHPAPGGFVDDARGIRIDPSGVIQRGAPEEEESQTRAHGRAATAAAILLALGAALPLLAARAARRLDGRMAGLAGGMCALCIFLLQAAAAGRSPPWLACLPAVALLIAAALRYRSPEW